MSCLRICCVALVMAIAWAAPKPGRAEAARDPWLRPFASSSIWNTAIGSAARYKPAHIRPAVTIGLDDELLYRVPADSPVRPVFAPAGWDHRAGGTQRLGSLQLPDDLIVPDARKGWTPNNSAALLMPDGRTVRNIGPMCRPTAGGPVYGFVFNPDTDLRGDGIIGSHGGSGMSALGGSIRLGELTGPEPIHHAIKLELFCKRYAYYGPGQLGFRWPAVRADAYAEKEYGGTDRELVMGSLLAIPPDVKIEDLKLKSAVGRKLFAALQDYGGYLVDDTAWDCHSVCAEQGVGQEVERAFGLKFDGSSADLKDDLNALFTRLAVVTNNGPNSVGGGGTPRRPQAPPLASDHTHENQRIANALQKRIRGLKYQLFVGPRPKGSRP